MAKRKQKNILAIDPGPELSAWLLYNADEQRVMRFGIIDNEELLRICKEYHSLRIQGEPYPESLAIEMVACYGMPVGKDVFETCVWIGRFVQAWSGNYELVYRKDVKLYLCNSMRAKDSHIRQALIDRFGGSKRKAIGLKATPGPLYGIKKDLWSALAVAITFADKHKELTDANRN